MRQTKQATAESRLRIVGAASRLLRERGVEGASVADVMHAAGMTHGGFYKHFASKDELGGLAARAAFDEAAARFDARADQEGRAAAIDAYFAEYLSPEHVDHPGAGCPMAGFGADAGRRPAAFAEAFAEGAEKLVRRVAGEDDPEARAEAIRRLVMAVGAVVVARAVGSAPLRQEVLAAAAAALNV